MRIATNTMEAATLKIFCPAVIGFAASLVEEIKEIKEIFVPTREAFLLFLQFLRDLKHASCLDLFYYPKEIKEIAEIIVTGPAKFFLLFLRDIIISCG